jgi:hypothetical protein
MEKKDNQQKIQAIKHIMETVFSAQNALRALAPEFKWAGLGNLLGDYGECIGIDFYNLKKAPTGANGYDALTEEGKTVQIKTNHAASMIGFRGDADLLLVLHVNEKGEWNEIYYDDFKTAKNVSNYSRRDNKQTITITKLSSLKKEIDEKLS